MDIASADFAQRYALKVLSDREGVLVDLNTGAYFRLNGTAALIAQELMGEPAERPARLAERLKITTGEALSVIDRFRRDLLQPAPRQPQSGPTVYEANGSRRWAISEGGRTMFSIDAERHQVRLEAPNSALNAPVAAYLQALVPKLLALLGVPVLHASSVLIQKKMVAFSGQSGAGKTTTALAFKRAGARLLTEDLIVLLDGAPHSAFYVEGEKRARAWAATRARTFEARPSEPLDYSSLTEVQSGEIDQLEQLWFIAAKRRRGVDFQLRRLSVTEGCVALLGNGFLASSEAVHWREFLERATRMSETTDAYEVATPAGLESLATAAARYMMK